MEMKAQEYSSRYADLYILKAAGGDNPKVVLTEQLIEILKET